MIQTDTTYVDSPYIVSNTDANAYWLASPSARNKDHIMIVMNSGSVDSAEYNTSGYGFRPLICLNSNFTLEKVKDTNGKIIGFNIVEKSE